MVTLMPRSIVLLTAGVDTGPGVPDTAQPASIRIETMRGARMGMVVSSWEDRMDPSPQAVQADRVRGIVASAVPGGD